MVSKRWVLASLVAMVIGGFLAGRWTGGSARAAGPAPATATTSPTGAGPGATTTTEASRGAPARNAPVAARAASASAAKAAPDVDPDSFAETPAERDERHRMIDAHLTEKLGDIPADKRAALMTLNDEATEVQRKMRVGLMNGTLSDADYQAQQHQAVLDQLQEMRMLVTDDEYRKLTGLEPGVDPYEYIKHGVGGATGQPPNVPEQIDESNAIPK